MATTVSTFAIFQQLLTASVNKDSSLDTTAKMSMLTRLAELAREVSLVEDHSTVESVAGQVTADDANLSIEVATGATGNNRVTFVARTFMVPVTVAGTVADKGFMLGSTGTSANAAVAAADVSVQYRFSTTDPWKNFTQSSVLKGVTSIQFAADIADQGADAALPSLVFVATQE